MATISIRDNFLERKIEFSGEVCRHDIENLNLDPFDQALLRECSGKDATPADWLLALEMIFRRIGEQRKDHHENV